MLLSDNNAGVHPAVMDAIVSANINHEPSYGGDPYTSKAIASIQKLFENKVEVLLVTNGTACNVIALAGMLHSYEGVICTDTAHINLEECGAFEAITGSKLLQQPNRLGKLTPEMIEEAVTIQGDEHWVQPKVVSISQLSETGTSYSVEELTAIGKCCKKYGLYFHVDGARISSALIKEGVSLKEMIEDTGVDVLSFGGTKNGLMFGEAIIVLNPHLAHHYKYLRKQSMQLLSKMRFLSAQFIPYIEEALYLSNARKANEAMAHLVLGLEKKGIKPMNPEQGCILFLERDHFDYERVEREFPLHTERLWGKEACRIVTAWNTTKEEIDRFLALV